MPYWLMNFEEHCEVFLTTTGNDRQDDADILAKCLLAGARARTGWPRRMGKITVDSPIPYLLSDLTNILQNEMGKLDKATTQRALHAASRPRSTRSKADPRYQFMFSGMLVGDTMADFIAQDLPHACQRQADLDHRRVGRAVGHHLDRGRGAQPRWCSTSRSGAARKRPGPILLVCEEAHRYVPNEKNADGSVGRQDPQPDRQGRP